MASYGTTRKCRLPKLKGKGPRIFRTTAQLIEGDEALLRPYEGEMESDQLPDTLEHLYPEENQEFEHCARTVRFSHITALGLLSAVG